MNARALAILAAALLLPPHVAAQAGGRGDVARTLHNLSISGPGAVKSLTETEICRFCHIPHDPVARERLWNQPLPEGEFETAMIRSSAGTTAQAPQPDGASRLCLSCHDGTIATENHARTLRLAPGSPSYLGTDLSGSHPVSFVVRGGATTDGMAGGDMGVRPLASILLDRDVRLDAEGKMQCTSCHDPHDDSNYAAGATPHFLVKPATVEVCLVCHELL